MTLAECALLSLVLGLASTVGFWRLLNAIAEWRKP
jgi:hypothetical protein